MSMYNENRIEIGANITMWQLPLDLWHITHSDLYEKDYWFRQILFCTRYLIAFGFKSIPLNVKIKCNERIWGSWREFHANTFIPVADHNSDGKYLRRCLMYVVAASNKESESNNFLRVIITTMICFTTKEWYIYGQFGKLLTLCK